MGLTNLVRIATAIFIAVVLIVAVAVAILYTPSLSRETAKARYAAPESRFLTLESGAQAHVRVQGPATAPPLVLLHGSYAHLFTWEAWAAQLDDVRIITMDLPAHGLTGATPDADYSRDGAVAFVDAVLTRLGVDRFVIGGNSRGGGVAAAYAATYPQKVAGLVLVDATGIYGQRAPMQPGAEPALGFQLITMPGVRHLITRLTPRWLVADGLKAAVADPAVMTDEKVALYHDLLRMKGSRIAHLKREAVPNPAAVDTDALSMPTLIQWGEDDTFIPVSLARDWHNRLADSRLAIYDGIGHLPMVEAPEKSAADVRAFLIDLGWLDAAPKAP